MTKRGKGEAQLKLELKKLLELPTAAQQAVQADNVLSFQAEQLAALRRGATYISQLDFLRDIASKLTEIHDLQNLSKHILEGAQNLIPFTDGAIGLVDEGKIEFPYAIGKSNKDVKEFKIPIGKGLTGWAVKEKKPARSGNVTLDPRYEPQISTTRSELDMPIIYAGESVGVINIESDNENAFSEDDERLLAALAEHAAIAINNAKLFNEMNALREIDEKLASTLDPEEILELILKTVSDLIKCPEVSVGLVTAETNEIHFTFAHGEAKEEVLRYVGNINSGLSGQAIREKRPIRTGDTRNDPMYQALNEHTLSEMDVPMLFGGEAIGVLNAESPELNAFSQHDEDLLVALASQAALALRNSQSYIAAETMAAIGDVAGSIVHRLNNDVGAIRVFAQMMKGIIADNETITDSSKIAELIENAQEIEKLAKKVLGDVRTFREQFKETEPSWMDINQIIIGVVKATTIPNSVVVSLELADNLKQFWGTEVHLKEIFRNLVANAIHAMPNGGRLWISSEKYANKIIIRVKDTGTGISEKDLPFIFNRGFTTKKEGQQGLGYGLWWVKTYLRRSKGDLEVEETKPGVGSTFMVTLPLSKLEIRN